MLLVPNIFRWRSTWTDQGAHREGCWFCICLAFPKIHGILALLHKEGVLCIICTVACPDAIKWVTSSSCTPPPLVVPHPLSFLGGGGGGRHLVNPKFFVTAHCVVVWVTVLWGTAACILCTHGRTFCSLSLNWVPMLGESARPHTAQPWLLDMRLATVCMSMYGPVYSICTQKPKPIWAWNAVNCEPVVACGSELGWHFYAVRQFAVWHN